MNKTAARSFVYAALIFVAGLVVGLLSAPLIGHSFMRPPTPAQMSNHIMSHLQSRLDLTAEQSAQIKPIVDQLGNDMQGIWLDTTKRVTARMEQSDQQIAALLTPEQKIKMQAFIAENRERMLKRHIPGGPPRPPPG